MARGTATDFPTAYRLVITKTLGGQDYTEYVGPYQTIGAARGQLTQQLQMGYYETYEKKVGYIEHSTGWERLED